MSHWATLCLSDMQTPEPNCKSAEDKGEEKEEKREGTSSHDTASPSPVNFTLFGEGYVCLPNRSASRSTQDLVTHSDANTSTHMHNNTEQDQLCPDNTQRSDNGDIQPGLIEPTSGHQPSAYTSGPFTPWPQGGTVQASGYCLLPQPSWEQHSNPQHGREEHMKKDQMKLFACFFISIPLSFNLPMLSC